MPFAIWLVTFEAFKFFKWTVFFFIQSFICLFVCSLPSWDDGKNAATALATANVCVNVKSISVRKISRRTTRRENCVATLFSTSINEYFGPFTVFINYIINFSTLEFFVSLPLFVSTLPQAFESFKPVFSFYFYILLSLVFVCLDSEVVLAFAACWLLKIGYWKSFGPCDGYIMGLSVFITHWGCISIYIV